jgi:hypothetical protein
MNECAKHTTWPSGKNKNLRQNGKDKENKSLFKHHNDGRVLTGTQN